MKTRRVEGTDIQAALREVRRTMGPDAVIVSTRESERGIEIVAAAAAPRRERKAPALPALTRTRPARAVAEASPTPKAAAAPKAPAAPTATVHTAAPRVVTAGGFAQMAAGMARRAPTPDTGPTLTEQLEVLGLSHELRDALVGAVAKREESDPMGAALRALASGIQVEGPRLMTEGGRVAVLGGTGVGKTTTIAKLAAHFARRHGAGSVALINADHYRIGASEQLRRFGALLGIPVYDVDDAAGLRKRLAALESRKLVLVDSAGMSHGDVRFEEHRSLFSDAGLECYLTWSLNTQLAVLARSAHAYSGLRLRGCILTKEDEAMSLGAGISMAVRHRLPVSFITTGPGVPQDIRHAESARLVERARKLTQEREDEMSRHDSAEVSR